jgi:hypothetical protein
MKLSWRTGGTMSFVFSYYNNLIFKGSMELHVAKIIIVLLDVVKQHVRFICLFFFVAQRTQRTQRKECGFKLNNHSLVCATLSHGRFICFF